MEDVFMGLTHIQYLTDLCLRIFFNFFGYPKSLVHLILTWALVSPPPSFPRQRLEVVAGGVAASVIK